MDEKLEKYRQKLRREAFFNRIKQRLINMVSISPVNNYKKDETIVMPETNSDSEMPENIKSVEPQIDCSTASDDDDADQFDVEEQNTAEKSDSSGSCLTYFTYLLYFCFWATCWMIAIELKFGIVFLLFSALFGIYFNTRTGPKAKHEISAYSVFNENCHSIDGTLTAEQFEREIRYGPMTVRN